MFGISYSQWRTHGGEWGGLDPPTFEKDGPRDFPKNAIKSVHQGGGGRQIQQSLKSFYDISLLHSSHSSNVGRKQQGS